MPRHRFLRSPGGTLRSGSLHVPVSRLLRRFLLFCTLELILLRIRIARERSGHGRVQGTGTISAGGRGTLPQAAAADGGPAEYPGHFGAAEHHCYAVYRCRHGGQPGSRRLRLHRPGVQHHLADEWALYRGGDGLFRPGGPALRRRGPPEGPGGILPVHPHRSGTGADPGTDRRGNQSLAAPVAGGRAGDSGGRLPVPLHLRLRHALPSVPAAGGRNAPVQRGYQDAQHPQHCHVRIGCGLQLSVDLPCPSGLRGGVDFYPSRRGSGGCVRGVRHDVGGLPKVGFSAPGPKLPLAVRSTLLAHGPADITSPGPGAGHSK